MSSPAYFSSAPVRLTHAFEVARRKGDPLSLVGTAALAALRAEVERQLVAAVPAIAAALFAKETLLAARGGDRPDHDTPAALEQTWPGLLKRTR